MSIANSFRRSGHARWGIVLGAGLLCVGCVGSKRSPNDEEKSVLAAAVVAEVPADATKLDVNLENKVHLVGVKVEPQGAVAPGTSITVRQYWRCDEPPSEGWALYSHLHDVGLDKIDNLDRNGKLRQYRGDTQIIGPSAWERGKIYVDEQTFTVPSWEGMSQELELRTGIWKGDERLRILSGKHDGNNGAIVAKIVVKGGKPASARNAVPELRVTKLGKDQKLVIDGKGDEAAWASAVSTPAFVDVGSGQPNTRSPVNGKAKLLWDADNLYALFEVSDPDLQGGFDDPKKTDAFTVTGQPKLWTGHTIEIMLDPDGDGDNRDYYELQINTQNKVFHTQYDSYNQPKTDPNGPYGHEDWDPKLKSAVVLRGTLDDSSDKDEGYTVEVAIPWASFTKAKRVPPQSGDTWRMNFYAMQNNGGVAWSPILGQGNFHKASRFGKVTWIDPEPAPTTPTDAGAAAAAEAGDAGKAAEAGDAGRRGVLKVP